MPSRLFKTQDPASKALGLVRTGGTSSCPQRMQNCDGASSRARTFQPCPIGAFSDACPPASMAYIWSQAPSLRSPFPIASQGLLQTPPPIPVGLSGRCSTSSACSIFARKLASPDSDLVEATFLSIRLSVTWPEQGKRRPHENAKALTSHVLDFVTTRGETGEPCRRQESAADRHTHTHTHTHTSSMAKAGAWTGKPQPQTRVLEMLHRYRFYSQTLAMSITPQNSPTRFSELSCLCCPTAQHILAVEGLLCQPCSSLGCFTPVANDPVHPTQQLQHAPPLVITSSDPSV